MNIQLKFLLIYIYNNEIATGVIPEIFLAYPILIGLDKTNFSIISEDNPEISQ